MSEIAFKQNARDNKLTAKIGERRPFHEGSESASDSELQWSSSQCHCHTPDKAVVGKL